MNTILKCNYLVQLYVTKNNILIIIFVMFSYYLNYIAIKYINITKNKTKRPKIVN